MARYTENNASQSASLSLLATFFFRTSGASLPRNRLYSPLCPEGYCFLLEDDLHCAPLSKGAKASVVKSTWIHSSLCCRGQSRSGREFARDIVQTGTHTQTHAEGLPKTIVPLLSLNHCPRSFCTFCLRPILLAYAFCCALDGPFRSLPKMSFVPLER